MNKVKLKLFFEVLNSWLSSPLGVFLLGAFIGTSFFIYFFGLKVVNPTYVDWLLVGEDLKQHFLGWEFFRSEPWAFPLGKINSLAHPFGTAITFMDSIPLLAIPFKLFSAWLPENFQYIGFWGLLCYALQGGLAAIIIRRWTKNVFIIGLAAVIFVVNPMMLARMFEHTALGSHWIILGAICLMVYRDKLKNINYFVLLWALGLSLAVAIHPYFVPMVLLPFSISLILSHKTWRETTIKLVIPLVFLALTFWIIGGLSVSSGVKAGGLGNYAFNLNALVNPIGWSAFVRGIQNFVTSGEGMNYLGLGVIILIIVATYAKFNEFSSLTKLKKAIKKINIRYILVAISILIIVVLAISPRVQLNQAVIFEVSLPEFITDVWSMFRATGRLFWVVYYLIVVGSLFYFIKSSKKMAAGLLVVFLSGIVFLQAADIKFSPAAKNKQYHFENITTRTEAKITPVSPRWAEVAANKQHIVFLEGMNADIFFELSDVALKYDLTINNGYFARPPVEKIEAFRLEQQRLILEDSADFDNNLYVAVQGEFVQKINNKELRTIKIDNFIIIEPRN